MEEEGSASEDFECTDVEDQSFQTRSTTARRPVLVRKLIYQALPVCAMVFFIVIVASNVVGLHTHATTEVLDPCSDLHAQCNSHLKFVTVDICTAHCVDPCNSIGRCLVKPSSSMLKEALEEDDEDYHEDEDEDGLEEIDENSTRAEADFSDSLATNFGAQHFVKGYHQTSKAICAQIMQSEFHLGHGGWCGGGIYFATSPEATVTKAIAASSNDGCMIEATIDVGKQKHAPRGNCGVKNQEQLKKKQYDSVLYHAGDGDEIVVYDPARVVSKKIIAYKQKWRVNSLRRRRAGN